jgi:hypothetical protein
MRLLAEHLLAYRGTLTPVASAPTRVLVGIYFIVLIGGAVVQYGIFRMCVALLGNG